MNALFFAQISLFSKVKNIWGLVGMTFGQVHDCHSLLKGQAFFVACEVHFYPLCQQMSCDFKEANENACSCSSNKLIIYCQF